jgi:ATP-independent RNA helicase DbpA
MTAFNTIPDIPKPLLSTLQTLNFTTMTEIQEKSISPILEGKDILAQSKTGSGKTLAFGIPAIMKTDVGNTRPQSIIITPTRELAEQIATELRKVAAYKPNLKILTLYGGVPLRHRQTLLPKGHTFSLEHPDAYRTILPRRPLHLKLLEHWYWMKRTGCSIWDFMTRSSK